ncbi:MAG: alternate-type signal peptide domain-containing protein [Cryobacterium sp.]
MNKLLKGAIAGAAGFVLLLGGAGTFALWNDTQSVTGGTIQSGELTLTGGGVGTWSNQAGAITIGTYKIVPGDVLTYTKDLTVTATGATLKAKLGLAAASITAATSTTANDALAAYLNANAVVSASATPALVGTNPDYVIPLGTTVVTAKVTITFPSGAAGAENAAKLGSVNLNNVAVTLTQTTV